MKIDREWVYLIFGLTGAALMIGSMFALIVYGLITMDASAFVRWSLIALLVGMILYAVARLIEGTSKP